MKQLLIDHLPEPGARFEIGPRQARHLSASRRLAAGSDVVCSDSAGFRFRARIVSVNRQRGVLERLVEREAETGRQADDRRHRHGRGHAPVGFARSVELCPALLKGRTLDTVVRQATEVGVAAVRPVVTDHCVARPSDGAGRHERWRAIAAEATEQSGRRGLPVIGEPIDLPSLIATGPAGIVLHEAADGDEAGPGALDGAVAALRGAGVEPVRVLVGPEGGLSPREVERLRTAGWRIVGLPFPVLRAETASVVGAALVVKTVASYTLDSERHGRETTVSDRTEERHEHEL